MKNRVKNSPSDQTYLESGKIRAIDVMAVAAGESISAEYIPPTSLEIVGVKIDGVSYGVIKPYKFTNVNEDHQILYLTENSNNLLDFDSSQPKSGGCQYISNASHSGIFELLLFLFLTIICAKFSIRK